MGFFLRAVVSGFAFSLGKALFDKYRDDLGLGVASKDAEKSASSAAEAAEVGEADEVGDPVEAADPGESDDVIDAETVVESIMAAATTAKEV
ncbi:MAG: hypothetical protein Tsb0020_34520 [Haliangiales bacterium]